MCLFWKGVSYVEQWQQRQTWRKLYKPLEHATKSGRQSAPCNSSATQSYWILKCNETDVYLHEAGLLTQYREKLVSILRQWQNHTFATLTFDKNMTICAGTTRLELERLSWSRVTESCSFQGPAKDPTNDRPVFPNTMCSAGLIV